MEILVPDNFHGNTFRICWGQQRTESGQRRKSMTVLGSTENSQSGLTTEFVSVVIAFVLSMQFYASFLADLTVTRQIPWVGKLRESALWPVLDHPMFRTAHYPGDRSDRHSLIAILDDSTEIPIGEEDIPFWQLRVLQRGVAEGDSARIAEFVQVWESRDQQHLQGLPDNHPRQMSGVVKNYPRQD